MFKKKTNDGARDHLLVTGVDPASEFLDDFKRGAQHK
jgi:hypothetical protein